MVIRRCSADLRVRACQLDRCRIAGRCTRLHANALSAGNRQDGPVGVKCGASEVNSKKRNGLAIAALRIINMKDSKEAAVGGEEIAVGWVARRRRHRPFPACFHGLQTPAIGRVFDVHVGELQPFDG